MWTWQDPTALALAAFCLFLALRLHFRTRQGRGCGGCPAKALHGHALLARRRPT